MGGDLTLKLGFGTRMELQSEDDPRTGISGVMEAWKPELGYVSQYTFYDRMVYSFEYRLNVKNARESLVRTLTARY